MRATDGSFVPAATRAGVLVIGLGFLGRHVVDALAAAGIPARVLTRSPVSHPTPGALPEIDLRVGDASDPATLSAALEGVDEVVLCGGGLLPADSQRRPALDARLSLGLLETVLAVLTRHPRAGLTYLSSGGTVYGDVPAGRACEDAPQRPTGSYGAVRLVCEDRIRREARERGLRARILRCATAYGEHQRPDRGQGAVVTFLRRVRLGEPIVLFGDGGEVRDYVYAADVARAVVALLGREDVPEVLNVGAGTGTSLAELVAVVEAQVGRRAQVVHRPARPFDVRRVVLDTSRLRRVIAADATLLVEGVALTYRRLAWPQAGLSWAA